MLKKKLVLILLVSFFLILAVSVWWGGQDIWKLTGLTTDQAPGNPNSEKLIESLKSASESPYSKYNLSVAQYRNKNFEEAKKLLNDLLNEKDIDEELSHKAHYNLGNTLFRLSEQESNPEQTLELLKNSLMHYRIIIDAEKHKASYTDSEIQEDKDAHFNYALVRTKMKLLNDTLHKKQQEQAKHQQLYQLLKSLKTKEQQIAEQLDKMKNAPYAEKSLEQRKKLLELRKENNKQLKIIQEKLLQSLSQT